MQNAPESSDAAHEHNSEATSASATEQAHFDRIMRAPRRAIFISAGVAAVAVLLQIFAIQDISAGLMLATACGAVVCIFTTWNTLAYSPTSIDRLKKFATHVGGRFTLWRLGHRDFDAVPFAYDIEKVCFGMLNYAPHGIPVEIGHLASQVDTKFKAPSGRRRAYVVFTLPQRLPHMIISFGHLSKLFGIRIVPEQWDRSQRVEISNEQRFTLYVAEDGEPEARRFLTPEIVRLFEQAGRSYDIEIKGHYLYLIANQSTAAGSEKRWERQRGLIDTLASTLVASPIWEFLNQQPRHSRARNTEIQADLKRAVTIFFSWLGVITLVIILVVLWARGMFDWSTF